MGIAWPAFVEILKKSFNLKYLLYMLLTYVILIVVTIIGAFGLVASWFILFLIGLATYASAQFTTPALVVYAILVLIALFSMVILQAVAYAVSFGLSMNFGRQHLHGEKLNFDAAFDNTKKNFLNAIKLWFVFQIAMFIVVALMIVIALIPMAPIMSGGAGFDANAFGFFLIVLLLEILAFFLLALFLGPFVVALFQLPFFEGLGAKAAIKRAIELGKRNYWQNFKLNLLMWALMIFVIILFYVVVFLPLIATGAFDVTSGSFGAGAPLAIAWMYLMLYAGQIVLTIWIYGFRGLFVSKIYDVDTRHETKLRAFLAKKFAPAPEPLQKPVPKGKRYAWKPMRPRKKYYVK